MKITIGQQALSMLLTLLLVSVVLVPVVSAEGMQNFGSFEQPAGYGTEKYTVRLVDANITQDQISAATQTLMSSFEKEFRYLPPRFIGTSGLNLSEDEQVVAYVFRILPGGESISYAEVVSADDISSPEDVSSRVDAWMNELLKNSTTNSFNDVFCSDNRQPIHSATLCRIYPGIGQSYLATTWYWDSWETNAEQDYFSTQTTLTTRPCMSMSGYDPYRNYLFNVEINPDYSLNTYRHLPDVSILEKFPQTTAGFTTYDFCLNIGGCSLRWWLPGIPDTRVVRHHPYGNVYSWDEEFNIWADSATSSFNFSPAMSTYCSQSARDGSTYSVSRVKADVSDGWFTFHDGLPCLGPSGTNTLCHFGKVRWSGADINV